MIAKLLGNYKRKTEFINIQRNIKYDVEYRILSKMINEQYVNKEKIDFIYIMIDI